jgi:hypothetical protein
MKLLHISRRHLMALLATTAASTAPTVSAQVLVSETFNTGTTFSGWYWTGGYFQNPPSFNEAWNQSSAGQQFFTTSFAPTSLNVGDLMTATFLYNPNSVNITSVRVGLFSGTAPTENGWAQFNNDTAPSSTWTGYIGSLAIGSGNSSASLKTTTGTHPYFGAPAGITTAEQSFGTGALRAASFSLQRNDTSIVVSLSEGANFGSLAPVVSYTDLDSAITSFNILSFYTTTPEGNVDMRYDTITLQAVPEPSTYALLAIGVVLLAAAKMRSVRRKATAQARV